MAARVGGALETRYFQYPHSRGASAESAWGYGGCPSLCASEMRYYEREGAVRRADPFSVNPGLRPGLVGWRGMHRIAVPLSDGRHCCKARQQ